MRRVDGDVCGGGGRRGERGSGGGSGILFYRLDLICQKQVKKQKTLTNVWK